MKAFTTTIMGALLAAGFSAQALEVKDHFSCNFYKGSDHSFTVDVLKEIKTSSFIYRKFKVRITEFVSPGQPGTVSYTHLTSNSISTRTMAGSYYQFELERGQVIALTDLMYSTFKEENPIGFYGKAHYLRAGFQTPLNCQFLAPASY